MQSVTVGSGHSIVQMRSHEASVRIVVSTICHFVVVCLPCYNGRGQLSCESRVLTRVRGMHVATIIVFAVAVPTGIRRVDTDRWRASPAPNRVATLSVDEAVTALHGASLKCALIK